MTRPSPWTDLGSALQPIAAVVGGAGALAFVYLFGGAVMWLRLRHSRLPEDIGLSLLPKELLVVIGIKEVIIPAALAGAFILLATRFRSQRSSTRQEEGHGWKTASWLAFTVLVVVTFVGMLPLSPVAFIWFLSYGAVVGYWRLHAGRHRRGTYPVVRLVIAAVLVGATAAVAEEWAKPGLLPRAVVMTAGPGPTLSGDYLGRTGDDILVGLSAPRSTTATTTPSSGAAEARTVPVAPGRADERPEKRIASIPRGQVRELNVHGRRREKEEAPSLFAVLKSSEEQRTEIYSVDVNKGSNGGPSDPKRLTTNLVNDRLPSWAPLEKQVVFTSNREGNFDLFLMNPDGRLQKRLTRNLAFDYLPAWSSDGKEIAFSSNRDGDFEIFVMNADGSNQRQLTHNDDDDDAPVWGPDGRIAYMSDQDGDYEILVMDRGKEGKIVTEQVTRNDVVDAVPTWSSDGRLAFSSERDGDYEIYAMDLSTPIGTPDRQEQQLTKNEHADVSPAWSPDGKQLALASDRGGNLDIYVMDLAAGAEEPKEPLIQLPGNQNDPAWSPGGESIIFSYSLGRRELLTGILGF